jgi:hypothetical protein
MSEARRTGPQGRVAPPLALAASGWWWCLSRLGLPPGAGGRHVILLHPATLSGAEVQHRLLIYRIIKEICNAARELTFVGNLSGANEVPPVNSPGTGSQR